MGAVDDVVHDEAQQQSAPWRNRLAETQCCKRPTGPDRGASCDTCEASAAAPGVCLEAPGKFPARSLTPTHSPHPALPCLVLLSLSLSLSLSLPPTPSHDMCKSIQVYSMGAQPTPGACCCRCCSGDVSAPRLTATTTLSAREPPCANCVVCKSAPPAAAPSSIPPSHSLPSRFLDSAILAGCSAVGNQHLPLPRACHPGGNVSDDIVTGCVYAAKDLPAPPT